MRGLVDVDSWKRRKRNRGGGEFELDVDKENNTPYPFAQRSSKKMRKAKKYTTDKSATE